MGGSALSYIISKDSITLTVFQQFSVIRRSLFSVTCFVTSNAYAAWSGAQNLTKAAMSRNVEASVLLDGSLDDAALVELSRFVRRRCRGEPRHLVHLFAVFPVHSHQWPVGRVDPQRDKIYRTADRDHGRCGGGDPEPRHALRLPRALAESLWRSV